MVRRGGGVVVLALVAVTSACSSGGGGSKAAGEKFVAAPATTTSLSQLYNGSYDIDINQVVAGASGCRSTGTFHETVVVEDSGGARRVTFTNSVPDASGRSETEAGVMQPDGSFDATGTFGSGSYVWRGTLPGDGTVSGTFAGSTPAGTCTWRVSGRRT